MVDPEEVRSCLVGAFPGARIVVANPAGDGEHLEVEVASPEFAGRGLVEQHRMVYAALGELDATHPRAAASHRSRRGGRSMSDVIAEIEKEVKGNPVVIYMKGTPRFPMCGFSAATVEVLNDDRRAVQGRGHPGRGGQARRA